MALNINVQGFVDNIVSKMQQTEAEHSAIKVVVAQFDSQIQETIDLHTQKISELKAESNGSSINSAAIAYHERKLSYYMS